MKYKHFSLLFIKVNNREKTFLRLINFRVWIVAPVKCNYIFFKAVLACRKVNRKYFKQLILMLININIPDRDVFLQFRLN